MLFTFVLRHLLGFISTIIISIIMNINYKHNYKNKNMIYRYIRVVFTNYILPNYHITFFKVSRSSMSDWPKRAAELL